MSIETPRAQLVDNPMALDGVRAARKLVRRCRSLGPAALLMVATGSLSLYALFSFAVIAFWFSFSALLPLAAVLFVTIATPLSLHGALSGERENRTLDALLLTRLTPAQIVVGKFMWRVGVIAATVVLFECPIALGRAAAGWRHYGIDGDSVLSPSDFGVDLLDTVAWAVLLGGFSLWVSARTKRSVTSLTLVFASLLGAVVFLPVLANLFGADVAIRLGDTRLAQLGGLIQHINPFVIVFPNHPDGGHDMRDLWYAWGLDRFASAIYAGGGLLFLADACRSLRGARPARRIGFSGQEASSTKWISTWI